MNTPHKYADVIKHWADGGEIQWKDSNGVWNDRATETTTPAFNYLEWRIKPQKKKVWLNFYTIGTYVYSSKEEADRCATASRIACVCVEFEEGEGL